MTEVPYELLIGTGDNDSDSTVQVSLVNDKGESNVVQPAGSRRDNYEKGSIEVFDPVNFSLDGKPTHIKVYFEGKEWRIGGLWLTDKTTGETWYALPNCLIGSAGGANRSPQTFALEKITGGSTGPTFNTLVVNITTASGQGNGTNDRVFLKIFDGKGNSCLTQRPGAVDNVWNPINDWQAGTTQSARISATLTELGHAHHILLAKYGNDGWVPSAVTVEGESLTGSVVRHFAITHKLNESNNKWIFCKATEV